MIQEIKDSVLSSYIDYESYGRDVRIDEGGVYTQNGYYVCMVDTPDVQSEEVWAEIQHRKEDMRTVA